MILLLIEGYKKKTIDHLFLNCMLDYCLEDKKVAKDISKEDPVTSNANIFC